MMHHAWLAAVALATLRGGTALHMPSFQKADVQGQRDLVLMHVPFNFGHTIESVAMIEDGESRKLEYEIFLASMGGAETITRQATWDEVGKMTQPGGEVWGHVNPDLQVVSNTTGCPMFFTPQKYWPKELAESYFGSKTTFGMLRDPYERLVAVFRGQMNDYGGDYSEFAATCDVNGAVKKMMQETLAGEDVYRGGCVFLPQAEYFDGPHGIKLAVDNRLFPQSMNKVFAEHGYSNMHVETRDILHVANCNDVWSKDLDCETRKMVRDFYWRDFKLLCEEFGYCDDNENTCIQGVETMCPAQVLAAANMSAMESEC